jgi:hypothetical protein
VASSAQQRPKKQLQPQQPHAPGRGGIAGVLASALAPLRSSAQREPAPVAARRAGGAAAAATPVAKRTSPPPPPPPPVPAAPPPPRLSRQAQAEAQAAARLRRPPPRRRPLVRAALRFASRHAYDAVALAVVVICIGAWVTSWRTRLVAGAQR